MDPQSLFAKKSPPFIEKSRKNKKLLIACMDDLDDQPLIYSLKNDPAVQLKKGCSRQRFEWIIKREVDIGFISSADYCRLKGGWRIIPGICLSSASANNPALFFKKGLKKFRHVSIPVGSSTAPLVLKILMKELYQSNPEFSENKGDITTLLNEYDSVLVKGKQAVVEALKNPFFLNINEEWHQLTGFPLVSGFWIANDETVTSRDCQKIIESCNSGISNIDKICREQSDSAESGLLRTYFENALNFVFGEDERDSLVELYRYAFFYGFTEYIPEFSFFDLR